MYQVDEFAGQVPVNFDLFGYRLLVPSKHSLIALNTPGTNYFQPYRERGLGLIAKALGQIGRNGVAIDVGANIGDTAAAIASASDLHILCVEASDFYLQYLKANIDRHFKGRATIRHSFVSAMPGEQGTALLHWGGTAKPFDGPLSESSDVVSISELITDAGDVALLKIDTDGFDLAIVTGALNANPSFPIYFELEITAEEAEAIRAACRQAQALFAHALQVGYRHAFFWDDAGRFYGRIDLGSDQAIINVLNYLTQQKPRSVWGFDICLAHESDDQFFGSLSALISQDLFVALPA